MAASLHDKMVLFPVTNILIHEGSSSRSPDILLAMFALGGDLDRLVSKETLAEPRAVADEAASASQQQRQAAAVLSGNFNGDIFAWLTLARSARSIEPVPEQQPGRAHLSPSQIHALLALKDCPDDRIVACLELARHFRLYNNPILCNRITDGL